MNASADLLAKPTTAPRPVERIVTAHRQMEGAGFMVRRPLPSLGLAHADPFLLLDEMGPVDYPPGAATGAPDHPHRGFETVSYILEGEMEHEDSAGHRGTIGAGDVQWMTAGRGVIHSEMPSAKLRQEGGRMHGFQIWVNLPARDKMTAPRYQEISGAGIPEGQTPDGLARVRVVAGEALGARAVIETRTPIAYHDWTVAPCGAAEVTLPREYRAYVYVFAGAVEVAGQLVNDGELAVLGAGELARFAVPAGAEVAARFLLLAGVPLGEPVARYGPFVMNTQQELVQAFEDFREGRMGEIAR